MDAERIKNLHLIAAVARNRVIGYNGQIPWNSPGDLQHFKELTMGHTVIMGRRTFASIGRPLPGRENIIVTSTLYEIPGCIIVRSLAEALELASREIIFIIGGQQLYKEALPLAEYLDLTLVDAEPKGDTFFPEINWNDYEEVSREQHAGEPAYTFVTYCKRSE